jgi:urease accessory protein
MRMKPGTVTTITVITMTNASGDLYKLMAWLSPGFPVGAFSHSAGLENAIANGLVRDRASMQAWLEDILAGGSLWSDAVIFARTHDAAAQRNCKALAKICQFANALPGTAELRKETQALGAAFIEAAKHGWHCAMLDAIATANPPYPVAVAITAAGHGIDRKAALGALIHAATANLVSVAIRLVPLGQSDAIKMIAALEPPVHATADRAATTGLEYLTTNCLMADIASMRHETQETRLFRT